MPSEIRLAKAYGKQGAVVVVRLQPGTDLIGGIETVCQEKGIHSATLTCCIGSLAKAVFVNAVPIDDGKSGFIHGDPYSVENVQILCAQGIVSKDERDQYRIHMHGIVLDQFNKMYGGHFVKGRNPTLITVEVVISEIDGVRLMRRFDPEIGREQFSPEEMR